MINIAKPTSSMSNWKLKIQIQRADYEPVRNSSPNNLGQKFWEWKYDEVNKPIIFIDPPIDFVDLYFDIETSQITHKGLDKINKYFIKEHSFGYYNYLRLDELNCDINVISVELVNMCPKISFMRDYYNEKKARLDSLIYEPCRNGPNCKNRMICRYMH